MKGPRNGREADAAPLDLSRGLIPEIVLPVQFFAGRRGESLATLATKRLMLAILEDAMRCLERSLQSRTHCARQSYLEIEEWMADRDAHGPFAFETICGVFGIEPDCLRFGIRDWCLRISKGITDRRLARRTMGRIGRLNSSQRRGRRYRKIPMR